MKCKDCVLRWADPGEDFPTCKADPRWPAPCEIEEDDEQSSFLVFAGPRATDAARIHHYTTRSKICQVKIFSKIFLIFFPKPIDI